MHRTLARTLALLGATTLLALTGCSAPQAVTDAGTTAETPDKGAWPRSVAIPAAPHTEAATLTLEAPPQRIVTLDYESTEVVAELGAAERLVLIPEAVLNPALGGHIDELTQVERTFPVALEIDPETIISLAPDLVIYSPRHGTEAPIAAMLGQAGIATLQLPDSWSESRSLMTNIDLIGEVTGLTEEADVLNRDLSTGLENATTAGYTDEPSTEAAGAPKVLLITNQAGRPFVTAGEAFPVELLERAGAVNAAATIGIDRTGPISAEQLVQLNPDGVVLLDMNGTKDRMFSELLSNPAVATLPGVSSENVLRVDGRTVQALGLTDTVSGLETLSEWVQTLTPR